MKRLLASSILLLSAAGALAVGGTGAFFSDTETSSGNTFTAGAIDLKVDNESYYNGNACAEVTPGVFQWTGNNPFPVPGTSCAVTWSLDDLNNGIVTLHKFFDFSDIKPGDIGEDTISLHVNTNDAYMCAEVKLTSNDENTNTQPEINAGDTTTGPGQGELAQAVNFIWWADDGDNVLESNETPISQGPIGALAVGQSAFLRLADSTGNIWTNAPGPIPGNSTLYIGKAWCFGALTAAPLAQDNLGVTSPRTPANSTGGVLCSGVAVNDASQTDSLTADVSFSAIQSRNNTSFTCPTGHCPIGTQNILVPGYNFELPVVNDPAKWDAFSSPTGGWSVEWRDTGPTTFGPQTRPATAKLEYHRGVLGTAFDGDQYVELDSDWGGPNDSGTGEPASVTIYQDIATIPGKQYQIKYAFAARPDTPASDNNLEFRWGGVVSDTTGPTAGAPGPIVWSERVVNVVATTTTTRIQFTDLGTANSVGTFLDDIRMYTESCVQVDQ